MNRSIVILTLFMGCAPAGRPPLFPHGEGHHLLRAEALDRTIYTLRRKLTLCTSLPSCRPHLLAWNAARRRLAHFTLKMRALPYESLHRFCGDLKRQLTLPIYNSRLCRIRRGGYPTPPWSSCYETARPPYPKEKTSP